MQDNNSTKRKRKPNRWNELSTQQQEQVERYINLLLAEQIELELYPLPAQLSFNLSELSEVQV